MDTLCRTSDSGALLLSLFLFHLSRFVGASFDVVDHRDGQPTFATPKKLSNFAVSPGKSWVPRPSQIWPTPVCRPLSRPPKLSQSRGEASWHLEGSSQRLPWRR